MCNINDNAVQGRLSENYLRKKLSHEIFLTRNIHELRYIVEHKDSSVHNLLMTFKASRKTPDDHIRH